MDRAMEYDEYLKELGDRRAQVLAASQPRQPALDAAIGLIQLLTEQRDLLVQKIDNLDQQVTILRREVQDLARIVEQVDARVEKRLDHLPTLDS